MSNAGQASIGLNHGAGKGDKERSPGWRANYDDIAWPVTILPGGGVVKTIDIQLIKKGQKYVKRY